MFALKILHNNCTAFDDIDSLPLPLDEGISWINFTGDMEKAKQWLSSQGNLDIHSIGALCDELTRPRVFINANEQLVITLRGPYFEGDQAVDMVSLRAWMNETTLVTLSHVEVPAVVAIYERLGKRNKPIHSPLHLLWLISDLLTDQITAHITELDDGLNSLEDEWEAQRKLDNEKLHSIRMELSRLRRFISPQLEAFQKIVQFADEHLNKKKEKLVHIARWRESINAIKRDLEVLLEMRERVTILRDALQQSTNEATNKIMYLLSIVATFFLPLTFVASLLGMNVAGIPGHSSPWAFVVVCVLMLIIALTQWQLFKHWQWLK